MSDTFGESPAYGLQAYSRGVPVSSMPPAAGGPRHLALATSHRTAPRTTMRWLTRMSLAQLSEPISTIRATAAG